MTVLSTGSKDVIDSKWLKVHFNVADGDVLRRSVRVKASL